MSSYIVLSVIDDIVTEEYSANSTGHPMLFQNSAIYLYRLHGALIVTRDAWATTTNIFPLIIPPIGDPPVSINFAVVSAICQNISGVTTIWQNYLTIYQTAPETALGWNADGELINTTLTKATDAISPLSGSSLILVGNSHYGNEPRVQRNANPSPFGGWSESDTGLPQTGLVSRITDLDVAE